MEGVVGSIPIVSTIVRPTSRTIAEKGLGIASNEEGDMHVNRELDCESPEYEEIQRKPHVMLVSSSWYRGGKWHTEWRCSVNWFKSRGFMQGGAGGNIIFHSGRSYQRAYSLALKWAKKLGLPLVKKSERLLWVPDKKRTPKQRGLLFQLLAAKSEKEFKKTEARISSGRP